MTFPDSNLEPFWQCFSESQGRRVATVKVADCEIKPCRTFT